MAIGFTPKHQEDYFLNNLTAAQYLVIAVEAAEKINWRIDFISSNGLIANTNNGMFTWNAKITIKIENGVVNLLSNSEDSGMMDWGKNKKQIEKFKAAFEELKSAFSKEELALKYEQLKSGFPSPEEDILILPPPTRTQQAKDFFAMFVPTKGYFITPVLVNLNIIIFILMAITGVNIMSPDNESLIKWGANFKPVTLDGQWWRLITNCFLHIGIIHLVMNMYALIYIGLLLEPYLGKSRFIAAYLLTGIAASVASLWWHDLTISAGASGAIFGMYGVFLALLTTDLIEKTTRNALLTSIGIFVVYNLVYGMKGGIDNAAHIGGLLSGCIIGYAFIPSIRRYEEHQIKYVTIGAVAVLVLGVSFFIYRQTPNDIAIYDTKIAEFYPLENKALEIYNMSPDTPKDSMLAAIKNVGIYN